MLNVFPSLLTYTFFAPTLLRVALALIFASVAYYQWQKRDEIGRMRFPIVGHGMWVSWLCIAFNTAIAMMLLVGYYTQIAALLGGLSLIKSIILKKRYEHIMPISRTTMALMLVICVSLLITGAGAFAIDLPL